MKAKHYFLIILLCAVVSGCWVDPARSPHVYSNVTFIKNTLDYPVLVQSYFQKFNDSANFCQKEPIAWSEPILIQPNEYQIVMDYVIPKIIKIFDIDTVLIVDIVFNVGNILKINNTEAGNLDNGVYNTFFMDNCYNLKDDRYLVENVPWNIYPIYYDKINCSDMAVMKQGERETLYWQTTTNGYAVIQFFEINTEAACFAK